MSYRLDQRQLENVLDQLFEKMRKQGIHISDDAKEQLKKEITSELTGKLSQDDIKNVEVQKKLMGCITTYLLGGSSKQFKNKLDEFSSLLEKLKDEDQRTKPDEKLDLKLKADLALLKTLSHIFNPENKNKMELKPDAFAKKVTEEMKLDGKKNKKDHKEEELAQLQKQLEETLRNMYGGDNPTINGEVSIPVVGPIIGNLFGWTNQNQANPTSLALIVESATHNAGKSDPNGLENIAKLNEQSTGITEALDLDAHATPTYTMKG